MADLEIQITDAITVQAWATGRKEDRGELSIVVKHYEIGAASANLSPSQARKMAAAIIELADKAEKFSTRGFVGSDE